MTETLRTVNDHLAPVQELSRSGGRNMSWQEGLRQLTEAQRQLDADPYAALLHMAKAYKVDLDELADRAAGVSPKGGSSGAQQQEILAPVLGRLDGLERFVRSNIQSQQERELGERRAEIDRFATQNPLFSLVENEIPHLIPAAKARNPGGSPMDILKAAYDIAVATNPRAIAARQQQQQAEDADRQKRQQAQQRTIAAKGRASLDHRGGPGRGGNLNGATIPHSDGSISGDIMAAWAELDLDNRT